MKESVFGLVEELVSTWGSDNESLMICNFSIKWLTFVVIEAYTRVLAWRCFNNVSTRFKASARCSKISKKFGSRSWYLTPFASASPLSKKMTSNASINGRNLEIILMHDSPCVSHLVVHAFKTFRSFRFEASCACSNMACLMELYLNIFHRKSKIPSNSSEFR